MIPSTETSVFLVNPYSSVTEQKRLQWLIDHSKALEGYRISSDSKEAEIILFVAGHPEYDPYFSQVLKHPLFERYPEKCALYHDRDRTVTLARTIAPCITKWSADPSTKLGFHYIACPLENQFLNKCENFDHPRDYLFSFDGASNRHKVRKAIMQIKHPDGLLIDRGSQRIWTLSGKELEENQKSFADSMLRSHFVLCPAGIGPSSYRLFETMQIARVPVILSDQLIRPLGPNWDEISITIPEKMTHRIPEILESRKSESVAMGLAARKAWEQHFSPEASLQRLCEAADKLVAQPYKTRHRLYDGMSYLQPYHLRGLCRYFLRQRKQLKQELRAEVSQ
ncbi:exostosin domain-containing protein [Coraliomargarita sp. W4R53]